MRLKCVLAIVLLFLLLPLCAQLSQPQKQAYDEKSILLQQAQQFMQRRQFSQAELMYKEVSNKYPDDYTILVQMFALYITMGKPERGMSLLEANEARFPANVFTEQKILLLVQSSQVKEAFTLAKDYLRTNRNQIQLYNMIAHFFEAKAQFTEAIELYNTARSVANDPDLYTYELANDYFMSRLYPEALKEYFRYLSKNPGYIYFVKEQCRNMLKEDPSAIQAIRKAAVEFNKPEVTEVVAFSLYQIQQYKQALNLYRELGPEKYFQFGNELFSINQDSLAAVVYQEVTPLLPNTARKADAQIKLANLYIRHKQTVQAETVLRDIIDNKQLVLPAVRYQTRANVESRELMADMAIRQQKPANEVISWYDQAKQYAFNQAERNEIEYEIIQYQLMSEHYDDAKLRLANLLKNEPNGTSTYQIGYYYGFLTGLLSNDASADSLLNEFLVTQPGHPLANDALYLSLLSSELQGSVKAAFLKAYRLVHLYRITEAVSILETAYQASQSEELLLLAAEWAINDNDLPTAKRLYSTPIKDPLLAEYAQLQLAKLNVEPVSQDKIVVEFLRNNPDSVFSPEFRMMLTRRESDKAIR